MSVVPIFFINRIDHRVQIWTPGRPVVEMSELEFSLRLRNAWAEAGTTRLAGEVLGLVSEHDMRSRIS